MLYSALTSFRNVTERARVEVAHHDAPEADTMCVHLRDRADKWLSWLDEATAAEQARDEGTEVPVQMAVVG